MSREQDEKRLSTADFIAAAEAPAGTQRTQEDPQEAPITRGYGSRAPGEQLEALFTPDDAQDFQSRWDAVQIGFVDDPADAVRKADELVAQVMKSLAESFATERARFESQLNQSESDATESMRVALRRYRSFFQRLLSL